MKGAVSFFIIFLLIVLISAQTRKRGFNRLKISRKVENNYVFPGEVVKASISVENDSLIPIPFVRIEEQYPSELERSENSSVEKSLDFNNYVNYIYVGSREKVNVVYNILCNKRGVYCLKKLNVTIGDIFAFGENEKEFENFEEIVVYPTFTPLSQFTFNNNSISGDIIVRRWIFEDMLYIKGIREYTIHHRMRDIHWNSSSKMDKLMVKEYDYTSDRDIVFIFNAQCGEPYWHKINNTVIEKGIEILAAFGERFISQGVNPGILTNAQVIHFNENHSGELKPRGVSLSSFLEFCARIDVSCRMDFYKFLEGIRGDHNSIYIIITPYMDDKVIKRIKRLQEKGATIKVVDISLKGHIEVPNTEVLHYSWEVR